jgi:hypothetical protein
VVLGFVLVAVAASVHGAGAVILVGSGTPDAKDALIVSRLEQLGFTVDAQLDAGDHPADMAGVDLVFISESTSSANLLGAYTDSTVPVVNCETWTFDDMGFAAGDAGFNSDAGDTLTVLNNAHPITEGLGDTVLVHDPAISLMAASGLGGDVGILAVREDTPERAAVAVYEAGASTLTGETQAIHVLLFPHSTGWALLTDEAWGIVDRSILYALDALPVSPKGRLPVTWSALKQRRTR